MHDLIIVGGGPAALAAASYALDKQLDVVMVYEDLGGKIGRRESLLHAPPVAHDAPRAASGTYLPANDVVRLLINRMMRAGHILHDRVLALTPGLSFFSVETRAQGVLHASAVIIATGATPRPLGVPGAARLLDQGLSYSITTYAAQVAGQRVAVIGSTPRAILGTAELAQHAAQVALILPHASPLATPLGGALRHQPNIELLIGDEVVEVLGRQQIEALVLRNGGQPRRLPVDHAFVDLGLQPNSACVQPLVATDRDGFIIVDRASATSVPGIFAAGDVTSAPGEQVLVALGDGARAAVSAYEYCLTRRLALQELSQTARELPCR